MMPLEKDPQKSFKMNGNIFIYMYWGTLLLTCIFQMSLPELLWTNRNWVIFTKIRAISEFGNFGTGKLKMFENSHEKNKTISG